MPGAEMLIAVMSETKWEALRLAMYALRPAPSFQVVSLQGYRAPLAHDWYYQFRSGGYQRIRYVDISVTDPAQRELVRARLQEIQVQGVEIGNAEIGLPAGPASAIAEDGRMSDTACSFFRIFGYLEAGQQATYL